MTETRYNIALLALKPEPYISVAQSHFSDQARCYLLGPESAPHITICQFYGESAVLPSLIRALATLEKSPPVRFTGLGFSKDKTPNMWGASLTIARTPELMKLHLGVVDVLNQQGLSPLNSSGDLYRPHLTLARIEGLTVSNFSGDSLEDSPFSLVLGESDDWGQLRHICHRF